MIRPPSLIEPYSVFFSGDDAIIQPPDPPAEGATKKAIAAYKKALEEYAVKIRAARQTADWAPVTVEGKHPVKFLLRPMPFEGFAVVMGMRDRQEPVEDIALLAARLCLVEIEGVDIEVDFEQHKRFGKVAALSTFEKFGTLRGLRIAIELGQLAFQRAHQDPLG